MRGTVLKWNNFEYILGVQKKKMELAFHMDLGVFFRKERKNLKQGVKGSKFCDNFIAGILQPICKIKQYLPSTCQIFAERKKEVGSQGTGTELSRN